MSNASRNLEMNAYTVLAGKLIGGDCMEDLGINGRII
jgi:hypothetical protein